jgi:hypothetical protein
MEDDDIIKRLGKFKKDISLLTRVTYPVGIHKDGEEFNIDDIDSAKNIKKISENGGFRVQALNTGNFSGDYWVRLSCGILNKPILDSGCSLIAEVDIPRDLETIEVEILDTIDENLTEKLCENSRYPYLCKKTASMGIMSKIGDNITESFRKTIEHELTDYYDFVEFKEG